MADTNAIREITAKLENGIQGIFDSDKYAAYLQTMSRFHSYSTRNITLIHMQMPGATHVAGKDAWEKKFNRQVKEDERERGIEILAPTPVATDTKADFTARFDVVTVYDLSQTTGEPLPVLAETLTGDVARYSLFMDALRAVSPLPIVFEDLPPDTDGKCYYGDRIAIRRGMSEVQTVAAVIHEITHAKLHDLKLLPEGDAQKDRRTEEIEAESISYTVCQYYGVDTGANSFGYLAEWSRDRDLKELNASLDTIHKTAKVLINGIDEQYHALAKERGIDLSADTTAAKQDAPTPEMRFTANQIYAKYANIVADRAAQYAVSSATLLKTDETEARRACDQIVDRVVNDLLFEAGEHYPLYTQYMDNPDFKARLEDYAFIKVYLEPLSAARKAAAVPEPAAPSRVKIPDYGAFLFNGLPVTETNLAVGASVLLPPVFDKHNFNRDGKKRIRVTVEEPIGKYLFFSREENDNKKLYFLTASGRVDNIHRHFPQVWDDELNKRVDYRPTEAELDDALLQIAERFERDMADPTQWVRYQDAAVLNQLSECDEHNAPVRILREENDKQRRADAERERQAEKQQWQEKYDTRIDEIANAIEKSEAVSVRYNENEFYGKNPVLDLFRLYDVDIPLRTQGWVNTTLAAITESGYSYISRGNRRGSDTFSECLYNLRQAIKATPIEVKRQNPVAATEKSEPAISAENGDGEKANPYTHWLKIPLTVSTRNETRMYQEIQNYLDRYKDAAATIYMYEYSLFDYVVKLECNQDWNDLDLDANTGSHSLTRLTRKPANIINPQPFTIPERLADTQKDSDKSEKNENTKGAPMEYSELQQKGFEIAKRHEHLPLQDRLNIIAKTFNCKTARIETVPCRGKYRGYSDIMLILDNGASLGIGMHGTPKAKTVKTQSECVNNTLARFNPEIVSEIKAKAAAALTIREAKDNAVAAEKGLKPYAFLTVELNDSKDSRSGGYIGWYYVTLAVEENIFGFVETGLNYDIARGVLSEDISRPNYFVAGGIKDNEVDFVFNNVGHSSFNGSHQMLLTSEARQQAEKILNERGRPAEMDGIKTIEHELYGKFEALFPQFMNGEYDTLRLEAEHAKPLELEWVFGDRISIAHTYELDGNPAYEPMVMLIVDSANKTLTAASLELSEPLRNDIVNDDNGHADTAMQQNINNFTSEWIDRAAKQRFRPVEATMEVDENGVVNKEGLITNKTIQITFDAYGRPVMPEPEKREVQVGDILLMENKKWLVEKISGDFSINLKNLDPDDIQSDQMFMGRWKQRLDAVGYTILTEPEMEQSAAQKQYDINYGHLGNGLTVWNRAEEKDGDYVTVAHIGPDRAVTFRDKNLPDHIKAEIEHLALTSDARASVTQPEKRVFDTPPQGTEPERKYDLDYGFLGNGITVWNRAEEMNGESPTVAHISPEREVTFYDKDMPDEIKQCIDTVAQSPDTWAFGFKPLPGMLAPEPAASKVTELDLSLPDPLTSTADMNNYGYEYGGMLPLSNLRALELFDTNHCIYLLYPDNTEGMAYDRDEIRNHDGLCGIEREDWERSPVRAAQLTVAAKSESVRESELLHGTTHDGMYGIYQIPDGVEEARNFRYAPMRELEALGLSVDRANYELVYTAPLPIRDTLTNLHKIYADFQGENPERPSDYAGRSVSVSDVIVLQWRGEVSAHFVDGGAGFAELPVFTGNERQPAIAPSEVERFETDHIADITVSSPPAPNLAKLESDAKEGKVISLMDLAKASHAERKQPPTPAPKGKSSLLEKLERGKQRAAQQAQADTQKKNRLEVE